MFSCSTQLSMTFFLLINVKMLTIVGILISMSRKKNIAFLANLSLNKLILDFFIYIYEHLKIHALLS